MGKPQAYVDERGYVYPTRNGPSAGGVLTAIFMLVMIAVFAGLFALQFGIIRPFAQPSAPVLPPTAVLRVIQPDGGSRPIQQEVAPAVPAAPAQAQPAPAVHESAPSPVPPARQVIIVKNGADPAAAPVVIDRGTKRKAP